MELHWRAFELRPYPVPTLDPQGEYLTRVWKEHVFPLAEKMRFEMKIPPVQPRSRLAHAAAKWAGENSDFTRYNSALFKAFFQDGLDIGRIEILLQLAAELGHDPAALETSLKKDLYMQQVLADEERARHIGVRAVPAYVINGKLKAAGVQSLKQLQQLIREE